MGEKEKNGVTCARGAAGEGGITLIELVVVLFLLLMMIIPMAASVQRSLKTSNEVYRLAMCAFLAQDKIEEVRAKGSCYTAGLTCPPNWASDQGFHPIASKDYSETAPACVFPAPHQNFKCTVLWLESTVNGAGLKKYLRDIQVRVWFDEDSDNTWDASESDVLLQTGLTPHTPTGPSG